MKTNTNIYNDIATRTDGDIYIGVVGPVRSGKSTFIKKFMDTLVIPHIGDDFQRERANDELPQSSAGRTIMTTEPKFIPENAVRVELPDNAAFNVRMIDCVGYIVPSAIGYIEDDQPRMVMTPWYDEPIPFNMAAEIGTQKVINEHSTIGLVITTDGSISDIDREEYAEVEQRVIEELKSIEKPFIVLLNCVDPDSERSRALAAELSEKYGVSVMPVSCVELDEEQIRQIISTILFEFPVREVAFELPKWMTALPLEDPLKKELCGRIFDSASGAERVCDCKKIPAQIAQCDKVQSCELTGVDLGQGAVRVSVSLDPSLFYGMLSEISGLKIGNDRELLEQISELAAAKKKFDRVRDALEQVEQTGYGIVMPELSELQLAQPEIMKQGGRYGVRLKASAPSIHLMKANITTEVTPIVGSEKQSEELVMSMMSDFSDDPLKIWDSNIFGKSLSELVNEGLHAKLAKLPDDARQRLSETLERLINEGCSGLICIIL
ncbi:MAG: stage IV sporulation protein A [Acutalibacteraceae bacterium]